MREQGHDALESRVKLTVSELAANAATHTGQPFTVTVDDTERWLRVEVVDSLPQRVPMRVPTTGSAVDITSASSTGRGLQIVSALSNRWGVVLRRNVKTVWAEFDADAPARPSDPKSEDHRVAAPQRDDLVHLCFLGLPVRTAIASGLDLDDAIRDLQTQRAAAGTDELKALLDLVDRSAPVRLAGRHAALHAAGQDRLRYDLEIDATMDELVATGELNGALAQLVRPAGQRGPSDDVVAFRRWLSEETVRQRSGEAPTQFPIDGTEDWLWEQANCGYVTLSLDGQVLRTNATFERWFALDTDAPQRIARLTEDSDRVANVAFDFVGPRAKRRRAVVSAVRDADAVRAVVLGPDGESGRAETLLRALQQTLIPPSPPVVAGLDVAAAYYPAEGDVGGDFFDVFEVADSDWCVVLGDVSGKGVEAAIVTSDARHAVRSAALREPVPSGLMRVLNRVLVAKGSTRFCTVALLRLQFVGGAWVATATSGGHPYPLLIRHGTATKLGRPGSLLGVFDEVSFHDVSIKLAVGDALVVYTDGVTEARNAEGEFFGDERMYNALTGASYSAQAMVDALVDAVLDFQGGPSDDIAVVVIRRPDL